MLMILCGEPYGLGCNPNGGLQWLVIPESKEEVEQAKDILDNAFYFVHTTKSPAINSIVKSYHFDVYSIDDRLTFGVPGGAPIDGGANPAVKKLMDMGASVWRHTYDPSGAGERFKKYTNDPCTIIVNYMKSVSVPWTVFLYLTRNRLLKTEIGNFPAFVDAKAAAQEALSKPLYVVRDGWGYIRHIDSRELSAADIKEIFGLAPEANLSLMPSGYSWRFENPAEDWCKCGDPDCRIAVVRHGGTCILACSTK